MPLLNPGAVLRYEMADFDAADTYCFRLLDTDEGLIFTSAFDGGEPEAIVRFTGEALDGSRTIAVLSQGSWLGSNLDAPRRDEDGELLDGDLPPFLLGRAALRELRAGATRLRPEWAPAGSEPVEVTLTERGLAEIEFDGETHEVEVLAARGDGVELRVVDDEEWPLIVERVEGDNYWRLVDVEQDEDFDEAAAEEEDEDLPPPVPAGPLAPTGRLTTDEFVTLAQRLGVAGLDMDYDGSRFQLLDGERKIVLAAEYKIVLVAMPGGVLRRAHVFDRYVTGQVLGPLGEDDPVDLPGTLQEGLAVAERLAARAGADVLYPDALGPLYVALFGVRALAGGAGVRSNA